MKGLKFFLFTLAAFTLTGCKTHERLVEQVVVKHDTCFIQQLRRDSIYLHDSIYTHEWIVGETIRIETTRYRDRWHERIIRDTSFVARIDTVLVTKTETITARTPAWKLWLMRLGAAAIGAVITYIIVVVRRFVRP